MRARFSYALLWAAVIGCIVKIALAEATGRYHLATGSTILEGWRSLGRWTSWYFDIYIILWGFVYGGTAISAMALFPYLLPFWAWGGLSGLLGAAFVLLNRYAIFEPAMKLFIGIMFVVVVGLAILVIPDVGAAIAGLVPSLPDGSVICTLDLIGGVGWTIPLAAYGYWVNAKGWRSPAWMGMMRFDNRIAYIVTGIFVVAMLIVGAELLHAAQISFASSDRGLLDLEAVLAERFGPHAATIFLIGFAATISMRQRRGAIDGPNNARAISCWLAASSRASPARNSRIHCATLRSRGIIDAGRSPRCASITSCRSASSFGFAETRPVIRCWTRIGPPSSVPS